MRNEKWQNSSCQFSYGDRVIVEVEVEMNVNIKDQVHHVGIYHE